MILINYSVDPLQFYHKSFYTPQFSLEQRYQTPGLAKNYDYDRIIVGSSMTENFVPSYVDSKLGGHTLKLSIEGASMKEQYMIAKLAINTGKTKSVLWGVDYFSLRGDPNRVRDEQGEFPYYLYDNNPFNDLKYLVNLDTSIDAFKILASFIGIGKLQNFDMDLLYNWNNKYKYGKQIVLKVWENYKNGSKISVDEYEYINIKRNIDENIIKLIKSHPEVKFILYYPPYTILQHRYYYDRNPELFQYELAAKEYLFSQVGELPNVEIYDFQHIKEITFNLEYYKDLAHHSQEINEFIIDSIASGKNRVNNRTLLEYADELKKQVVSFKEEDLEGE
jgi:hypothetical protein